MVPRDNAEHSIIDSALIAAKTKSNIDTSYLSIKDIEKMNNLEIEEDQIRPFDFSFSKGMFSILSKLFSVIKDVIEATIPALEELVIHPDSEPITFLMTRLASFCNWSMSVSYTHLTLPTSDLV